MRSIYVLRFGASYIRDLTVSNVLGRHDDVIIPLSVIRAVSPARKAQKWHFSERIPSGDTVIIPLVNLLLLIVLQRAKKTRSLVLSDRIPRRRWIPLNTDLFRMNRIKGLCTYKEPVMQSLDAFFTVSLIKLVKKHSCCRWLETP